MTDSQCMSPSRLQFILDEIRCLNQSVSELSQEKEKLTENILNELKTSSSNFDPELSSKASSSGSAVTQIPTNVQRPELNITAHFDGKKSFGTHHEIDLVSGIVDTQKRGLMQFSNASNFSTPGVPVRLSQSNHMMSAATTSTTSGSQPLINTVHATIPENPNLVPRRLSFPLQQSQPQQIQPVTSASGYLIFAGGATPIQPRPSQSANSFVAQQHLNQIDGVRQQVSREVESLKSKLEQSETGRNNLVHELSQMRSQLDRLEQERYIKSPVRTPIAPAHVLTTANQSDVHGSYDAINSHNSPGDVKSEVIERFLSELESVKQQLSLVSTNAKQDSSVNNSNHHRFTENIPNNATSLLSGRMYSLEAERKRLEQLVRTLVSSLENAHRNNGMLAQQQQQQQQLQPPHQQSAVLNQQSVTESLVISELRRVAQSLSAELTDCRQRLKEANSQIINAAELRARQPVLEAELSRLRIENDSNSTQISELKRLLSSTNDRLSRLTDELEVATSGRKAAEQSMAIKEAEISKTISELQDLKASLALVKSQNDRLAVELQMKSERVVELEKLKDSLQQQQATAIAVTAEHHHQFFSEVEQLKLENADLKRRLMAASADAETVARMRQEMKNSQNELSNQNGALESAKQQLEAELQRYEEQCRILRGQLASMTRERDCTNNELEVARQERIRLMDEISKMRIALENAETSKAEYYEQEISTLKNQLCSTKTVFKCSQDEIKHLFSSVSSELDLVIDKTVFVLSLVLPQVEEPSTSLNLGVDSPPTPLNLNKISDSLSLARFLQEKIGWISRNLEKLCTLLDRFPLSNLFRSQYGSGELINAEKYRNAGVASPGVNYSRSPIPMNDVSFSCAARVADDIDDNTLLATAYKSVQNSGYVNACPVIRTNVSSINKPHHLRKHDKKYDRHSRSKSPQRLPTAHHHLGSTRVNVDPECSMNANSNSCACMSGTAYSCGMRRTQSLSTVDRFADTHDQPQSQAERGKLFDLILRSQQILGDLKVDLSESDKIISKIKPRPRSFAHSSSDLCADNMNANLACPSIDNHRHPMNRPCDSDSNQKS